jgi:hypothetical protein
MYLDKAKQKYQILLKLRNGENIPRPCTIEEIQDLSTILGLQLPDAYIEFLQWTGKSGGCFASDEFDVGRVGSINITHCKNILAYHNQLDSFPDDAIFIIFYHGGYAFDFIRSSEGVNPPIHQVIETETGIKITWRFSETLEEHCLKEINRFISHYEKH